ncbi:DUF547 domain-containing protein [Reinekea sp.]|jgi:hypothetical protein|uniref:DUF547 domain-containing protein n=1 Tax=Reinekea sp. TaxID=1970455 RepID=UPI002A7F7E34|nr:DUF547 domain-containing protein [Reinekea sp.]
MRRLLLLWCFCLPLAQAEILTGWHGADRQSTQVVDHAHWQMFLDTFLDIDNFGQTYFDYARVSRAQIAQLGAYLTELQAIDPLKLNKPEQMAYWINLYNALTVSVILDEYPVKSIRNIGGPLGGFIPTGPWSNKLIRINGQMLSLDDIEHAIVRPKFNDYRVHFAFNCAAKGCPNLAKQAFTGANIETLLNSAQMAFINHQRGVRVQDGRLIVSKIFDWYQEDFVPKEEDLPLFLAQFAEPKLRAQLKGYRGRITYEYDWSLNEAAHSL